MSIIKGRGRHSLSHTGSNQIRMRRTGAGPGSDPGIIFSAFDAGPPGLSASGEDAEVGRWQSFLDRAEMRRAQFMDSFSPRQSLADMAARVRQWFEEHLSLRGEPDRVEEGW